MTLCDSAAIVGRVRIYQTFAERLFTVFTFG